MNNKTNLFGITPLQLKQVVSLLGLPTYDTPRHVNELVRLINGIKCQH